MLQAALAAGAAHRRCVFEVFARRLPDGRRYGVVAGHRPPARGARAVPLRRRRARAPADAAGRRRGDARLPRGLPLRRRHLRLRRGRVLLPRLAGARRRGRLRRRRASSRRSCCRSSTTTAPIASRRLADDVRRRRPALHRDGLPAHARGVGRRRRPRGIHRRVRRPRATSRRAAATACPTTGTAAHAFTPAARRRAGGVHGADRVARQGHDAPRRHLRRHDARSSIAVELAGPELGAVRLDSGDLLSPGPRGARPARRASATPTPGSSSPPTSTSTPSPASRPGPVDRYGVGTALVTGSGAPTAGMVYKLVAREDDVRRDGGRREEEQGQASVGGRKCALRRRGARGRAGRGHRHRRGPRATTATTARS